MLDCRRKRHQLGAERGAVAVEFALVMPILAGLIFAIVTFGLAYSRHMALTNTVREAARFGASTDNTVDWGSAVLTRAQEVYFNADSTLAADEVCALLIKHDAGLDTVEQYSSAGCKTGTTNAGALPATPSNVANGTCYVKVWAEKPANLNWLVFSTNIGLRAASVSFYDRDLACP